MVGWGPVLDEDHEEAAEVIAKADPRHVEALTKRGIENLDHVFCAPISAGVFGHENEVGRRMIRVLSFHAPDLDAVHALWAHPIDGIVCHVDLTGRQVLRVVDTGYTH